MFHKTLPKITSSYKFLDYLPCKIVYTNKYQIHIFFYFIRLLSENIQFHSHLCTEYLIYISALYKLRESAEISAVRYTNLNGIVYKINVNKVWFLIIIYTWWMSPFHQVFFHKMLTLSWWSWLAFFSPIISLGGGGVRPPPCISGDNAHKRMCYTCFWTNFLSLVQRNRIWIPETSTRAPRKLHDSRFWARSGATQTIKSNLMHFQSSEIKK